MFRSHSKDGMPFWAGKAACATTALMLTWSVTAAPLIAQPAPTGVDAAQTAPPAPSKSEERPYTLTDLEYLLGPIALYPDTLLALILPASTVPLDIIHADRWLAAHEDEAKRGDFSGVDATGWDMSVQALTRFPDLVALLADHLEWTESLGVAFSMQPDDVAVAIQSLRAQAEKVGNLKTTPQQVVTVREEASTRVIYIAPANPERIYVPVYDTATVFTAPVVGALAFTTGVVVGSAWNSRWGWNNRGWNTVWVYRPGWRTPPGWRYYRSRPGVPPSHWANRPDIRVEHTIRRDRDRISRPERPGSGVDRAAIRERAANRPSGRPAVDRDAARQRVQNQRQAPAARPDVNREAARQRVQNQRNQRNQSQQARPNANRAAAQQRVQERRQQAQPRPNANRQAAQQRVQNRQGQQQARPNANRAAAQHRVQNRRQQARPQQPQNRQLPRRS